MFDVTKVPEKQKAAQRPITMLWHLFKKNEEKKAKPREQPLSTETDGICDGDGKESQKLRTEVKSLHCLLFSARPHTYHVSVAPDRSQSR